MKNNTRPNTEKKELALSSSPFVYIPVDIPAYTVEATHRDPIDGELLQRALDRTVQRMPYLTDTMVIENAAVYYAKNPLPMEAVHTTEARRVGGSETNYHMLDLTWDGNVTRFSMFHGFCDGLGMCTFLESVLYHYYCMKDAVEYDPNGIRTDKTRMTEGEIVDPFSKRYEVSPDYSLPERKELKAPFHLPEILCNQDSREVFEYGFRLPSDALMRFVKENDASPVVILSMFVGEAIQRLYPDADAPIMANIPVSVRRQLGCEETFKNCSDCVTLPVSGTPMDALPFNQRAVQLRAMLKQQISSDRYRTIYNKLGPMYHDRMIQATDYWVEREKNDESSVTCDTFFIDYIGSMHKTEYSEQITDVHFFCRPALGKTLHVNVIEHNGEFCINCLAMNEIPNIIKALEQVIKDHSLPVKSTPMRRFTLSATAWWE